MQPQEMVNKALKGDRLALTRLLSLIENQAGDLTELMEQMHPHTGKAHRIGITGAPGTGKSTLTTCLTSAFRKQDKSVAILAIDPSSPFSGGALLGDRIRMRELAGDNGVFIRSMATRGHAGGIASAAYQAIALFDAVGFDIVIIETVGAGQGEVEIASMAHTTIVVEAPGLGDEIQANKAGILEIADIFVINKADLPGVIQTENALRSVFDANRRTAHKHLRDYDFIDPKQETNSPENQWHCQILKTIAHTCEGIDHLVTAIEEHAKHLHSSDQWHAKMALQYDRQFESRLSKALFGSWKASLTPEDFDNLKKQLNSRIHAPEFLARAELDKLSITRKK
jgi:LAO/AO transport system kinase